MLHAYKINFFKNNKRYEFVAEPSPIFKKMINQKLTVSDGNKECLS